jgi:uncharacterized protein (DUF2249 family)
MHEDIAELPTSKAERAAFVSQMFARMQPADIKSITLSHQPKPIRSERHGHSAGKLAVMPR